MSREWSETLLATDASSVFGFGVSAAHVTTDTAQAVGRLADSTGAYVRLDRTFAHPDDEPERPRKGMPHKLGLSKHSFVSVISARTTRGALRGT